LLFLVDAKDGLSPLDQEIARMLRKAHKPVVLVINKIDTEKHEDLATDFASLGFSYSLSVSAAHGRGISELVETIDHVLPSPSHAEDRRSNIEHPIALAIVGRPNVGNLLINFDCACERAIVSELREQRAMPSTFLTSDSQEFLLSTLPESAGAVNIRTQLKFQSCGRAKYPARRSLHSHC
jgi:predicted GTPase